MTAFRFNTSALSHVGMVRTENEDAMVHRPEAGFWAVADGMGGLQHGQWASQEVAARLSNMELDGEGSNASLIGETIDAANARILEAAADARIQMGTTVAALRVFGTLFIVFWAGDSRVYLCRNGSLAQLTRDHTLVQELVDAGVLTPDEASHHPRAHVISRAVGVEAEVKLDTLIDNFQPRDVFLLCTDGLSRVVNDGEIAERLTSLSPDAASRTLVELALERGAPDNVTVIAVACEEITRLVTEPLVSADA